MSPRPITLVLLLGTALLTSAACQSGGGGPSATGVVQPTVAGRTPATYATGSEAHMAFTRMGGSVTATLQDSAWLRFLGNPDEVARTHRAYFEYGYTTFDVELRTKDYPQATIEQYTLEDSNGRRLCGRPKCFEGSPVLEDQRWFTTFRVSFQHMLTKDIEWIRLTRAADGSSVEWRFIAEAPCPPCPTGASPGAGPPR